MKRLFISALLFFSFSSFSAINVSNGQSIKAADLNAIQQELTDLKSVLQGNTIEEEFVLYTGNHYPDGSSSYNLWSSSQHQTWDYMDFYIAYDSGSNTKVHRVVLGPSYAYGNTSGYTYTTLISTYSDTYRRIIITTTGINIHTGNGAGFFIRKVVGIKKTVIP